MQAFSSSAVRYKCGNQVYLNFGCNFLVYNFRYRNIVIGQGNCKRGFNRKFLIMNGKFSFDDPDLLEPVNIQISLHTNIICSVRSIIYFVNDLSCKGGCRIQVALHILFIKMFSLEATVKSHECVNADLEG